jgi:uncharacterized protein YdeI (YjbR/CyaY-like superfamily)
MFPCYTYDGTNVIGLAKAKNYFGLWFYQGALMKDARGVLVNAQEGKTKAMRHWRFASEKEIKPRFVKVYIKEAIELAKQGRSVKIDRNRPISLPPELASALNRSQRAKSAFAKLTKGRQRDYAEYITTAKQAATKARRLEKILPMIRAGKGLNDRYQK